MGACILSFEFGGRKLVKTHLGPFGPSAGAKILFRIIHLSCVYVGITQVFTDDQMGSLLHGINCVLSNFLCLYNKLYWRIKPKRHECKRDLKSHARHSTSLHTIYKLLLLNRLYINTCQLLGAQTMIKFLKLKVSKLKVLEQPKAISKNRNHDRKIRSQTKGICLPSMICDTNNFDIKTKYMAYSLRKTYSKFE